MPEFGAAHLVWWIPALPLFGFLFHAFLGKRFSKGVVVAVACTVVFAGDPAHSHAQKVTPTERNGHNRSAAWRRKLHQKQ